MGVEPIRTAALDPHPDLPASQGREYPGACSLLTWHVNQDSLSRRCSTSTTQVSKQLNPWFGPCRANES